MSRPLPASAFLPLAARRLAAALLAVTTLACFGEPESPPTDSPPDPVASVPDDRAPTDQAAPDEGSETAGSPSSEPPGETAPAETAAAPAKPPEPEPTPAAQPQPEPAAPLPSEAPPEPVAEAPPEDELEFDSLEQRLRDTKAIGVFTKLELKNQINDLIDEVRKHHESGRGQLAALRGQFDRLVLKVMTLLQDKEAELAAEIGRAREALWSTLADPVRFAKLEAT